MQAIDLSTTDTLVPPGRLGALLSERRAALGRTLHEVAAASEGVFDVTDLALAESGTVALADDDVRRLATLYGVELRSAGGERAMLEIDLAEGQVLIGNRSEAFRPGDDDREIMARYLALVYRVRDIEPGQILPARAGDLLVLADVFGTSPEEVRRALDEMMLRNVVDLRQRHSLLARRLIVPAVGALVAVTAFGGLLLTQRGPAPAAPVKIGTALVIERGSSAPGATGNHAPTGPNIGPNIGDAVTIER